MQDCYPKGQGQGQELVEHSLSTVAVAEPFSIRADDCLVLDWHARLSGQADGHECKTGSGT